MDLENVHLAVDLETLEARTLFRYRPAHVTELAFADGRTELKEVRLRSVKSDDFATIDFRNQTKTRVRALWIDFNGHEIAYSIIEPGERKRHESEMGYQAKLECRYRTYKTHPWVIREVKTQTRMMINNCEVIFGGGPVVEGIIREPPFLKWTESVHKYFPEAFRDRVRCLLLCHHRLEKGELPSKCSKVIHDSDAPNLLSQSNTERMIDAFHSDVNLGDVPSFLLRSVASHLALESPVSQTLLRGLEAAPDMMPVDLPDNVPLAEFSPNHVHAIHYPHDISESESDEDDDIFD